MKEYTPERVSEHSRIRYKKKFPRGSKLLKRVDEDGQPFPTTGMSRVHRLVDDFNFYDKKRTRETSVINRFLTARRGQLWDDVWSEVCSVSDSRTIDGHRFRDTIDSIVCQTAIIESEEIMFLQNKDSSENFIFGKDITFFVHPVTRTLELNKEPEKQSTKKKITIVNLDGELFHCHNNIWFFVEMKEVDYREEFIDGFGIHIDPGPPKNHLGWWLYDRMGALKNKYGLSPNKKHWYCSSKKSIDTTQIQKIKQFLAQKAT